jgi:transposase
MPAIGIDTHKRTLAACAVDDVGTVIDERTFGCDPAGFVELAAWAGRVAPEVRIGIEGSAWYGAPLAHHLVAAGFVVREVPPQLSRREVRRVAGRQRTQVEPVWYDPRDRRKRRAPDRPRSAHHRTRESRDAKSPRRDGRRRAGC